VIRLSYLVITNLILIVIVILILLL